MTPLCGQVTINKMQKEQSIINTVSRAGVWQIFALRKSAVTCHLSLVKCSQKRGSLLLELLIAISILAVVLSVGSQAVFVSLKSGKVSAESDVAIGLANEALEAVRGVAEEKWQNIYNLAGKGSTHYYATSTVPTGKWTLATGDEIIDLNTARYTRYVVIDNVSRDSAMRAIENPYVSADDDPGTQKATVMVSWAGGDPVVVSGYFFRWRNKACNQTGWSTGGSGTSVKTCPDTSYDTKDAAIDTTGGSLKLQ